MSGYCGTTPSPVLYTASNIRNTAGLSKEEIMRHNYHLRLLKLYNTEDLEGQSAGGGKYVFPKYGVAEKAKPKLNTYNFIDSVYKQYDIKPCYI